MSLKYEPSSEPQGFLTSMQEAEMEHREIETREAQVLFLLFFITFKTRVE